MTPTQHSNRHFDGIPEGRHCPYGLWLASYSLLLAGSTPRFESSPEDRRYLHGLWLAPYSLPLAGSTLRSESSLGGKYFLCGQWAHWNHRTGQQGSYVGLTGVHPDPLGRGDRARRGKRRKEFSFDVIPFKIPRTGHISPGNGAHGVDLWRNLMPITTPDS